MSTKKTIRDIFTQRQRAPRLHPAFIIAIALALTCWGFVSQASAAGAQQISGIAYPEAPLGDAASRCTDEAYQDAHFAAYFEGDLQGCLYTYVESYACTPSGAYQEAGREVFVSNDPNRVGTFETTYIFRGKLGDCPDFATEIHGFCQHPIVAGSGTGDFEGVRGTLHLRDDVQAGNFPYTGHLK